MPILGKGKTIYMSAFIFEQSWQEYKNYSRCKSFKDINNMSITVNIS